MKLGLRPVTVLCALLVVDELRAVPGLAPLLRAEPAEAKPVAAAAQYDAVVSADGSGTHATVQAAVNSAPANAARPFVIWVKPGVYREHVAVDAGRPNIRLVGEPGAAERTVITGGTNVNTPGPDGKKLSTRDSSVVLVQARDFCAENITFENTTTREERVQALAFYVEADRAVFRNCRFLGWQDTLRSDAPPDAVARHYFVNCTIEGHCDFIYAGGTAVFDRCHLYVKADGYITAASTAASVPFGYVFLDCKVTAAPEAERGFYLGRPWRPYASTLFVRCELPAQVRPEGWHNWGNVTNEVTVRYAEYKSSGRGGDASKRVPWARQLSDAEAAGLTVAKILGGADGWDPTSLKLER